MASAYLSKQVMEHQQIKNIYIFLFGLKSQIGLE